MNRRGPLFLLEAYRHAELLGEGLRLGRRREVLGMGHEPLRFSFIVGVIVAAIDLRNASLNAMHSGEHDDVSYSCMSLYRGFSTTTDLLNANSSLSRLLLVLLTLICFSLSTASLSIGAGSFSIGEGCLCFWNGVGCLDLDDDDDLENRDDVDDRDIFIARSVLTRAFASYLSSPPFDSVRNANVGRCQK